MKWRVEIGDEFETEFDELPDNVQDEMLANTRLLEEYGPQLGHEWIRSTDRATRT